MIRKPCSVGSRKLQCLVDELVQREGHIETVSVPADRIKTMARLLSSPSLRPCKPVTQVPRSARRPVRTARTRPSSRTLMVPNPDLQVCHSPPKRKGHSVRRYVRKAEGMCLGCSEGDTAGAQGEISTRSSHLSRTSSGSSRPRLSTSLSASPRTELQRPPGVAPLYRYPATLPDRWTTKRTSVRT